MQGVICNVTLLLSNKLQRDMELGCKQDVIYLTGCNNTLLSFLQVGVLLGFTFLFGSLSLFIFVEFGWKSYVLVECNPTMRCECVCVVPSTYAAWWLCT